MFRPYRIFGAWVALGLLVGAAGGQPPFSGTAFISTEIITDSVWSDFDSVIYTGLDWRLVFDRRVNDWVNREMHLFDATFFDGLTAEIQVNPEFGGEAAAAVQADKYARSVGRLPTALRVDVDSVTIHRGVEPFGGGNRNILIHTGQAAVYGQYLEEILFHEATHTSYDAAHQSSAGWINAQQSDPTFISTYAQNNPDREDVAESLLPWFAVHYRPDAISQFDHNQIVNAIPNRLAYFDALPFSFTIDGDFDDNLRHDCLDVNALVGKIVDAASGGHVDLSFDLTRDGNVDQADLDSWLTEAGAVNLSSGNPYLPGDANLDGVVDGSDFIAWNDHKFTSVAAWCSGDFHADGTVDGQDFILWNGNKFTSSDGAVAVPEPSTVILSLICLVLTGVTRRFR